MSDVEIRRLERLAQQDPDALRALFVALRRIEKMSDEEYDTALRLLNNLPPSQSHRAALAFLELVKDQDTRSMETVWYLTPEYADDASGRLEFLLRYLVDPHKDVRRTRGKFDLVIDSLLYPLDEEQAVSDGDGDSTRLFIFEDHFLNTLRLFDRLSMEDVYESRRGHLTAGEIDILVRAVGAILHERNDGGVSVDWIEDRDELLSRWDAIELGFLELGYQIGEEEAEDYCNRCSALVAPPETYLDEDGVCNLCVEGDE